MRPTGTLQRLNDLWWHLRWLPSRLLYRRKVHHRRLFICLVIFILLYVIGIVLNPVVAAQLQRQFAERGLASSSYVIYDSGKVYCLDAPGVASQNIGRGDGSILAWVSLECRVDAVGWPAPLTEYWRVTERWSLDFSVSQEDLLDRYLSAIGRDHSEADYLETVLDTIAGHGAPGEIADALKKQSTPTSTWICWPVLAYNVMITPLLPLGLYMLWGWWVFLISRNWRRAARGRCPVCGYSLRGIEPDRCPECGHRMTVKERDLIARKYGESEA